MKRLIAALAIVLHAVSPAQAHLIPGIKCDASGSACRRSARAIHKVWKKPRNAHKAQRVAACESGLRWWVWSGDHYGLFQLNSDARATYGYGDRPLAQSRGAHRMWEARGWQPWTCA